MDWNNIDLTDGYERSQNILDGYDFDTLLLEISCNIKDINKENIKKQFCESLNSKIECAKSVFNANLDNILKEALKERAKP